jgi:hypothetical protein
VHHLLPSDYTVDLTIGLAVYLAVGFAVNGFLVNAAVGLLVKGLKDGFAVLLTVTLAVGFAVGFDTGFVVGILVVVATPRHSKVDIILPLLKSGSVPFVQELDNGCPGLERSGVPVHKSLEYCFHDSEWPTVQE